MIVKRRTAYFLTEYIAEDGKSFAYSDECRLYEKFYKKSVYDLIKDYVIFFNEEDIEAAKQNKFNYFSYIYIKKLFPEEVRQYLSLLFRMKRHEEMAFSSYYCTGLHYLSIADSLNGGSGYNDGWQHIDEGCVRSSLKIYEEKLHFLEMAKVKLKELGEKN